MTLMTALPRPCLRPLPSAMIAELSPIHSNIMPKPSAPVKNPHPLHPYTVTLIFSVAVAITPIISCVRHNPIPVTDPEAREAPPPDPTSMFGIFDGHGGSFTSNYVAKTLVKCLQATPGWKSGDR